MEIKAEGGGREKGWKGRGKGVSKRQSSTQCTEYHTVTCMDTCMLLGVYAVGSPDLLKKGEVLLLVLISLPEHPGNLQFGETVWTNLRWRAEWCVLSTT